MRTHMEWNVLTQTYSAPSPTILSTRSRISFAALFVNVIASMLYGFTDFSSIKYAILCVITLVLPEPAPASIRRGPSVYEQASICLSFNPKIEDINYYFPSFAFNAASSS